MAQWGVASLLGPVGRRGVVAGLFSHLPPRCGRGRHPVYRFGQFRTPQPKRSSSVCRTVSFQRYF